MMEDYHRGITWGPYEEEQTWDGQQTFEEVGFRDGVLFRRWLYVPSPDDRPESWPTIGFDTWQLGYRGWTPILKHDLKLEHRNGSIGEYDNEALHEWHLFRQDMTYQPPVWEE